MISTGHSKQPTTVSPTAGRKSGQWVSNVPTYHSSKPVPSVKAASPTGASSRTDRNRFRGSSFNGSSAAVASNIHQIMAENNELRSSTSKTSNGHHPNLSGPINSTSNGTDEKDGLLTSSLPSSPQAGTTKVAANVSNQASPSAPNVPFWTIAAMVTMIFLMHGWLAEMLVISVVNNGYSLGWFFAFLTVLGQWIPTLPRKGWNKSEFRIEHAIVGTAHCLSLGMSNSGGMLVEYNTYALFKSSKVVFVMMVSWATLNVQPSTQEIMWGLGLMIGLIMLTGADEKYHDESNRVTSPVTGAALLFAGISGNALVSVGQQAALQRRSLQKNTNFKLSFNLMQCPYIWGAQNSLPHPAGTALPSKDDEREALLFYSNCISITMLGGVCLMNGEMQQGIKFFTETATIKMWLAQIAAMALVAFGQRLVLTLNGAHGATASAAVLTFRKVASFVTSVFVFPKPFHPFHAMGLFVVVTSAVMIQRAEALSASQRKLKGEAAENAKKANRVEESV